jgi:hypothetical protein
VINPVAEDQRIQELRQAGDMPLDKNEKIGLSKFQLKIIRNTHK